MISEPKSEELETRHCADLFLEHGADCESEILPVVEVDGIILADLQLFELGESFVNFLLDFLLRNLGWEESSAEVNEFFFIDGLVLIHVENVKDKRVGYFEDTVVIDNEIG